MSLSKEHIQRVSGNLFTFYFYKCISRVWIL